MPRNSEAVTSRFRSTSIPYLFLTKMIYKTNQISLNFTLSIHTKQQLALYEWEPHNVQHTAVLKKVRYALCPMPYALCPMPYALCPIVPYLSEKGYILLKALVSMFHSIVLRIHS
jgi:hypothetical protein